MPDLKGFNIRCVSNLPGTIPWSLDTLRKELLRADIVVVPATEKWKSANRVIESVVMGCFVVAERHPAFDTIPGIWHGNIKDGVHWAIKNQEEANQWTREAQSYSLKFHGPSLIGSVWKTLAREVFTSTLDAGKTNGLGGLISTYAAMPT
jgi:hypothetical protein